MSKGGLGGGCLRTKLYVIPIVEQNRVQREKKKSTPPLSKGVPLRASRIGQTSYTNACMRAALAPGAKHTPQCHQSTPHTASDRSASRSGGKLAGVRRTDPRLADNDRGTARGPRHYWQDTTGEGTQPTYHLCLMGDFFLWQYGCELLQNDSMKSSPHFYFFIQLKQQPLSLELYNLRLNDSPLLPGFPR